MIRWQNLISRDWKHDLATKNWVTKSGFPTIFEIKVCFEYRKRCSGHKKFSDALPKHIVVVTKLTISTWRSNNLDAKSSFGTNLAIKNIDMVTQAVFSNKKQCFGNNNHGGQGKPWSGNKKPWFGYQKPWFGNKNRDLVKTRVIREQKTRDLGTKPWFGF